MILLYLNEYTQPFKPLLSLSFFQYIYTFISINHNFYSDWHKLTNTDSNKNAIYLAGSNSQEQRARKSTCLMMAERRVVITGMGITSCLGNTLEDVTTSLKEAKSGITFCERYQELGLKSQVYGRPKLTDEDFIELIPKSHLRFMGENCKFAYIAMKNAIEDVGLNPEDYEENQRVACILGQGGTSFSDITETADAVTSGNKRWKNKVGPFRMTRSMNSAISAVLSTAFKLQGPSFSISSACSTGAHCIGTGFEQILLDKSDMAFCGAGKEQIGK